MTLYVLASLIGLIAIISICIKRQEKQKKDNENLFWEREHQANFVRRKSLDGLNYISVPTEQFPTHLLSDDSTVKECIDIVNNLATQKILNLTGFTNTDLKLEYGTANITELTEYDQNYIVLVRTLQKWADALLAAGHRSEATVLMEYAVSTNTDVSRTYYCLADYWLSQGETAQVERLIGIAENLKSSNKNIIVRNLKEKL